METFSNRHYQSVPLRDGELFRDQQFPTIVRAWGWSASSVIDLGSDGTHYGFVTSRGVLPYATLYARHVEPTIPPLVLRAGMYFSVPGGMRLEGGQGVIVTRLGHRGMFYVGGPVEPQGRLRYIDGCSDSLLIPPTKRGDPCLNHLHFPPGISQTRHTHPSIRAGVVIAGRGRCVVPANDDGSGEDVTIPLAPGNAFMILPDGHHSFFTDDQPMDVIAYHPDSDTGPTDDDHPMINRTIVDGVPASKLDHIKTRELGALEVGLPPWQIF